MPIFSDTEDEEQVLESSLVARAAPDKADIEKSMDQQYGYVSPLASVGGAALFGVSTLADNILSSVNITDPGDFNLATNSTLRAAGLTGAAELQAKTQKGAEVAAGIYGIIVMDLLAGKALKPVGALTRILSKTPGARRIAALDAQYAAGLANVEKVGIGIASSGAQGAQQYTQMVNIARATWDKSARAFVGTENVAMNATQAFWGVKKTAAAIGARRAVTTEALLAVTMNENGFLYTEDASTNLMYAALGIGAGAVLEGALAGYRTRKVFNSDLVARKAARALDPYLLEAERTLPKDLIGPTQPGLFTGGVYTDKATALSMEAYTLTRSKSAVAQGDMGGPTLVSNRNALATEKLGLAHEEIQKVTIKGISTDGASRFSLDDAATGGHLKSLVYHDPSALVGVEAIGVIPEGKGAIEFAESHAKRLDSYREELSARLTDPDLRPDNVKAIQEVIRRIDFEKTTTPLAVMDNQIVTLDEADLFTRFEEPTIKRTKNLWEVESDLPMQKLSLDDSLIPHFPSGRSMETSDVFDVMRMYRMGNQVVEAVVRAGEPLVLPKNPSWFQLDMAEQVLRQSDGEIQVAWPAGMDRESAQVESFAQKIAAMGKHPSTAESAAEMRIRYNLPAATAFDQAMGRDGLDSFGGLARTIANGDAASTSQMLRKLTIRELHDLVADAKLLRTGVQAAPDYAKPLQGNSFRFGLNDKGEKLSVLMMYRRNVSKVIDWSEDTLAERIATQKLMTARSLSSDSRAPLTAALTNSTLTSPDHLLASQPQQLMDLQLMGSVFGSSPRSWLGATNRTLKTTEQIARDTPPILAAQRQRDTAGRITRAAYKSMRDLAFGDKLSKLAGNAYAKSRMTLNHFHSFRSGWDLKAQAVPTGDGFHAFDLADTAGNRARYQKQFGMAMPEGAQLVDSSGQRIVLDDFALEIQNGFNIAGEQLRLEKNALLRSQGQREIQSKAWWTPPPQTKGMRIGFVLSPDGEVVSGYTARAETEAGFAAERSRIEQLMQEKLGVGYLFITQADGKRFTDLWDDVAQDFVAPTKTAVQPNKRGGGKLVGPDINLQAFDDSLRSLRDQYLEHGNEVFEVLYKDQIQAAKMRSAISGGAEQNGIASSKAIDRRGVHDFYLEALRGSDKQATAKSELGKLNNEVEALADGALAAISDLSRKGAATVSQLTHAVNAWTGQRMPGLNNRQAKNEYDSLVRELGDYMPVRSIDEFIARKFALESPLASKKIINGLHMFTAGFALRMLEVAHPIMNMAGMVNAMPSVIRHAQRRAGETAEEWGRRMGHSGHIIGEGEKAVGVIDMAKIATNAFAAAWNKKRHVDFDYMNEQGLLSQEVAELFKQFGRVNSKRSWTAMFFGDPATGSRGLFGWTGILSDKSEDFTRAWGQMVGLEIADHLGMVGKETRNIFAHDMANKMIANYNPANRPEALQGVLGLPVGLFQSYIINYYQRLFRYIETGDTRSLAVQLATQQGLFGVGSIPGWNQLADATRWASDGERDIDGGIWQRFGTGGGDLLAGGLISNLPKLFGAPAVDLFSRGDTNIRVPGVGGSGVPAWNMIAKGAQGFSELWDAFTGNNPDLSTGQLAEILSNMTINRPLSGTVEQLGAGGMDTDSYGQVVSDTQGWMESVYRMLGVRSMRQTKEIEAFYSDKTAQETQASRMDVLRRNTRSAMRANREDELPDMFTRYVEEGGDPRAYRGWMKENFETATTPRSRLKLESLMKNPGKNQERMQYYLDRGVGITEDEQLGEMQDIYPDSDNDPALDPNAPIETGGELPGTTMGNPDDPYGLYGQ